jgi:penicillin-binding protein 2
MSVIHAPRQNPLDVRSLAGLGAITLVLVGYMLRLWYIQIVLADGLRDRAERSGTVQVSRLAPRGQIVSRDGAVLAGTSPKAVLMVRPKTAAEDPETLAKVAAAVGVSPNKLTRKITENAVKGDLAVPTVVGLTPRAAAWVAERRFVLPGYSVDTVPVRTYRDPVALAHLLGYTGVPSERDVERLASEGLRPQAYVGKDGLERAFEADLMGRPGLVRLSVDARRRPVANLGEEHPVPGHTLALGLDLALQQYALEKLGGRRGAVVALDPRSGDVLALASSPTYDASLFLGGISQAEYSALRDDPAKPLFPRAVAAAYAPGSTFKIVTTLAAMLAGKFSPTEAAYCRGYYSMGSKRFRCLGVHGAVTFDRAMTKSCNAYFADLAVKTTPEHLRSACEQIGLGGRTGIELPSEARGVVPTAEWWAKHRDRKFSLGDTANFGVGQGELACTPLQMACVAALVANRGTLHRPRLVRAIIPAVEGAAAKPVQSGLLAEIEGTPEFWTTLHTALRHVVTSGTARSANLPGTELAGKTGSAENSQSHETHSWFIGFAPASNPRIALAVVVENAGHGGEVAAPIAGQVVRRYLDRLKAASSNARAAAVAQAESGPGHPR